MLNSLSWYKQTTGTLLHFWPFSTILSWYGTSCHDLVQLLTHFHDCVGFYGWTWGLCALLLLTKGWRVLWFSETSHLTEQLIRTELKADGGDDHQQHTLVHRVSIQPLLSYNVFLHPSNEDLWISPLYFEAGSCTRATQCNHLTVNHPLAKGIYSLTGKAYLGRWESSTGAGFESSASIFAVSWLLTPSFTSRSLVEIITWLFDGKKPSRSLPERELLILSFLTRGKRWTRLINFFIIGN